MIKSLLKKRFWPSVVRKIKGAVALVEINLKLNVVGEILKRFVIW